MRAILLAVIESQTQNNLVRIETVGFSKENDENRDDKKLIVKVRKKRERLMLYCS